MAAADDQEQIADGLGFVRIVKGDEKLRSVPIVLLTDRTLSHLEGTFEEEGIADVLIKPFTRDDVLASLRLVKAPSDA